jgi:hypothetical protein
VLTTDRDWLFDVVEFVVGRRSLRGRRATGTANRAAHPHLAAVGAPEARNP